MKKQGFLSKLLLLSVIFGLCFPHSADATVKTPETSKASNSANSKDYLKKVWSFETINKKLQDFHTRDEIIENYNNKDVYVITEVIKYKDGDLRIKSHEEDYYLGNKYKYVLNLTDFNNPQAVKTKRGDIIVLKGTLKYTRTESGDELLEFDPEKKIEFVEVLSENEFYKVNPENTVVTVDEYVSWLKNDFEITENVTFNLFGQIGPTEIKGESYYLKKEYHSWDEDPYFKITFDVPMSSSDLMEIESAHKNPPGKDNVLVTGKMIPGKGFKAEKIIHYKTTKKN